MTDKQKEEVTPDQLMNNFKGSSLKSIVIFTLVIHLIFIVGGSITDIYKRMAGKDAAKLNEAGRMEAAMVKATSALRDIAAEYGLKPQDLSSQLAGGAPKAPESPAETGKEPKSDEPKAETDNTPVTPEKPESAIEKEVKKQADGPALPDPVEDEEDLLK